MNRVRYNGDFDLSTFRHIMDYRNKSYYASADGKLIFIDKAIVYEKIPTKDPKGYLRTWWAGRSTFVHRIVAGAFLPGVGGKVLINHKNGIKTDNNVSNLEWCTNQENIIHSFRDLNRKAPIGALNKKSKPIYQLDMAGNLLKKHDSIASASRYLLGHTRGNGNVFACLVGKKKHAYGFIWRYADEVQGKK